MADVKKREPTQYEAMLALLRIVTHGTEAENVQLRAEIARAKAPGAPS